MGFVKRLCEYPECGKPWEHRHHIVYKPAVIARLCRKHHEDITICNINAVDRKPVRRKLRNAERWRIWREWLSGKLIPERTPHALAWIEGWGELHRKPNANTAVMAVEMAMFALGLGKFSYSEEGASERSPE